MVPNDDDFSRLTCTAHGQVWFLDARALHAGCGNQEPASVGRLVADPLGESEGAIQNLQIEQGCSLFPLIWGWMV